MNTHPVTIPDSVSYQGVVYDVIGIGRGAFKYCWLHEVSIPESVQYIEDYAFAFSSLYSITIPNSVKRIGKGVFDGCEDLESVVLSNQLTEIPENLY